MVRTHGRIALTFLSAALVAASLAASDPARTDLRVATAAERLVALRGDLGLSRDHAFLFRTSHTDELGQTHARFQQTYKGVKVWGGDVITHSTKDGQQLPLTHDLKRNLELAVSPSLPMSEALAAAHADLAPKGPYAYQPSVELVIFPVEQELVLAPRAHLRDDQLNAEDVVRRVKEYRLAYHIHTQLENGSAETSHTDYLLDAHSGEILKKWSTLRTTAAAGTGKSQWYGTVNLNTNSTASGFELRDMTRGSGGTFGNNVTTNLDHGIDPSAKTGTIYTDADNAWGDGLAYGSGIGPATNGPTGQTAAVDAHRGLQATWDFFKNVFGRNGIDGFGKATYNRMHYGVSYDNAFWDDTCFCMTYGDGDPANGGSVGEADLDTAGHEMTHGVCSNTANLTYSGESGGLNESNSDIFGTCVEFYVLGAGGAGAVVPDNPGTGAITANYTLFENSWGHPGSALRYMYKPSKDGFSPDAWSSSLGSLDVHYSSGPMNRCWYFLARGSSSVSTSDTYSSYLPGGMTGVGNDHAARIWYRALTTYLTSSSNYAAARTAAINAAKDLYGAGGADEAAVWNAFAAINVGSKWSGGTSAVTASISAPAANLTVASGTTVSFTGSASGGTSPYTYSWTFGDGGTATTASASHVFTNTGTTSVTYTATFTAKDAANQTGTASRTVTVTPAGGGTSVERVVNGDFENGVTGWSGWTRFIGSWSSEPAYSGTRCVWLGGVDFTATKYIYQQLTIPSTATSATLSFYLHVDTQELPNGAYDKFYVQLQNSSGTLLKTLATYSNLNAASGYQLKSFNVGAYKGQTIRIYFKSVSDSTYDTNFVVDKVSLVTN